MRQRFHVKCFCNINNLYIYTVYSCVLLQGDSNVYMITRCGTVCGSFDTLSINYAISNFIKYSYMDLLKAV